MKNSSLLLSLVKIQMIFFFKNIPYLFAIAFNLNVTPERKQKTKLHSFYSFFIPKCMYV